MTCWKINLHLYWVLGITDLRADSQSDLDARHCQIKNLFDQLDYCQILFFKMILSQFWLLHQSYSPGRVDKFEILNRLISISEAQDIPVWISSVKVGIPAARRILNRVLHQKLYFRHKFDDLFFVHTLSHIKILGIVSFWIRSGDPFWSTRLLPDSVL